MTCARNHGPAASIYDAGKKEAKVEGYADVSRL